MCYNKSLCLQSEALIQNRLSELENYSIKDDKFRLISKITKTQISQFHDSVSFLFFSFQCFKNILSRVPCLPLLTSYKKQFKINDRRLNDDWGKLQGVRPVRVEVEGRGRGASDDSWVKQSPTPVGRQNLACASS